MIPKIKLYFHVVLLELIQDHFQQNSKDNFQNKQSSFLKDQNLVAVNWKISVMFMQCHQSMVQK